VSKIGLLLLGGKPSMDEDDSEESEPSKMELAAAKLILKAKTPEDLVIALRAWSKCCED
jgi:hypothetical protein